MAKNQKSSLFSFQNFCYIVIIFSICSIILFLSWTHCCSQCYPHFPYQTTPQNQTQNQNQNQNQNQPINLLLYPLAWNNLVFPSNTPSKLLKIALFVKKWPQISHAGGLERHALTLHLALANRGHELHIFTTSTNTSFINHSINKNLHFHFSQPSPAGYLDQSLVWDQFQQQNSTIKPFDIVHTESVGLRYTRSRHISNLAVTWHGIAYETIHSDIIQELLRPPQEPQTNAMKERTIKVVEEVKFFTNYAHHVATSDHAGDILKRVYMIPQERVHIILNGVDQQIFKPNISKGNDFKQKHKVPNSKSLVIGLAGRLVKDKGHPLMFEALKQIIKENKTFLETCIVLVAGDGPWATRYRELGKNVIVLGTLEQNELASFYNAIDIFVNPTLRAQGLDHTLLEAMLSGKPIMATRLGSIVGSIIVDNEIGYTFSPSVIALKKVLYESWSCRRGILKMKGKVARERGLKLFTANKMVDAYERLFLCIVSSLKHEGNFCEYHRLGN